MKSISSEILFISCFHVGAFDLSTQKATILLAHDTRPSCASLVAAFQTGVELMRGILVNYGTLSTPQLHYIVRCLNTGNAYGEPNESGYFGKLARAFANVWSVIDFNSKYETDLYVDGANGVGAPKINALAEAIAAISLNNTNDNNADACVKLNWHLFNESVEEHESLNHLCGADFVKVQQRPPANVPVDDKSASGAVRKYCSLDGDADRVVYFFLASGKFTLLDGDKISTLVRFVAL